MDKFLRHKGIAAPLMRNNVDTDSIIPSVEMKRVSKRGLANGLFAAWRYLDLKNKEPNPEFVLNKPEYQGASILLSGRNFGCGSSREHAVWALDEFGVRVLIAPTFGTIFSANCVANGLLPACLPEAQVHVLADWVAADPLNHQLDVDLICRTITTSDGQRFDFEILDTDANMLMSGLDPISLTLQSEDKIKVFEESARREKPWFELATFRPTSTQ